MTMSSSMKRFVFLILLICLVIDDKIVLAKPKDDVKSNEDSNNPLHIALEKVLKTKLKKLNMTHSEYFGNVGFKYQTEKKELIFVKEDSRRGSDKKFRGEFEGLKAIRDTKTILAPRPIATGGTGNGSQHFIAMEYMNITLLNNEMAGKLGSQLADMHLCNIQKECRKQPPIKQFGFHVETRVGFIPQNNTWTNDWITFFVDNRLNHQIELLNSSKHENKEKVFEKYWPRLKPIIPSFFEGIDIKPSLLHGDLWTENTARWLSKPVVFDPAVFYGHHEFDIASTNVFGSFLLDFYEEYFKKIPKAKGYYERKILYHLYIYLIHWNQYGGAYSELALLAFQDLLKEFD